MPKYLIYRKQNKLIFFHRLKIFMPQIFNLFDFQQKVDYRKEILAGFTVAMTMIPESLSFAILAGLPPLVGLYAAVIMGFVTSIFGGRPGLISGGAGATVIVLIALMKSHGIEYVFAAVALAGILQILIGFGEDSLLTFLVIM
jgi:SulP family sulfate permease